MARPSHGLHAGVRNSAPAIELDHVDLTNGFHQLLHMLLQWSSSEFASGLASIWVSHRGLQRPEVLHKP